MPAVSKKQRRAMAIAEHHPDKLHSRNRGLLKMTKAQLGEFASTKESRLPARKKRKKEKTNAKASKRKRSARAAKGTAKKKR